MMNKKILITGGAGFTGRHCIEVLSNSEYEIYASYYTRKPGVEKKNVKWFFLDILDSKATEEAIESIRPNYIINCAWYVEHGKYLTSPLNVKYIYATVYLWELFCRFGGSKGIFLGTCLEKKEKGSHYFETIYTQSKIANEKLIRLLNQKYNIPYVWGRIFGIYGPGEPKQRIVPHLIDCYSKDIQPEILNPNFYYDYCYVKNFAWIIQDLLFSNVDGIVDIGESNLISLGSLAKYIHLNFFKNSKAPLILNENQNTEYFKPDLTQLNAIENKSILLSFNNCLEDYIKELSV